MNAKVGISAAVQGLAIVAAALTAGCSDPADPPGGPVADVAAEAPEWGPWSTAVNLGPVVNSSANEQHPSLSKDGLTLYFVSNRSGGFGKNDIWVTQRASVDAPWGPPSDLGPDINTIDNDFAPDVTIDDHHLYFNSDRAGGCGGSDLYVARRKDKQDDFAWQGVENLGCGINTTYDEAGPLFFDDETTGIATLYFTSFNRPGGLGDFDIYVSTRGSDDEPWGPGVDVVELNGPFRDTRTAISRDGLELFLSSDVTGRPNGVGSQDLWVSTRATTADLWSAPTNLGPGVNSTAFDGAPALSFDGTTLYFFSARPGGFGGNDLYVTTRTRLNPVAENATQSVSSAPQANAETITVFVTHPDNEQPTAIWTASGMFSDGGTVIYEDAPGFRALESDVTATLHVVTLLPGSSGTFTVEWEKVFGFGVPGRCTIRNGTGGYVGIHGVGTWWFNLTGPDTQTVPCVATVRFD